MFFYSSTAVTFFSHNGLNINSLECQEPMKQDI